MVRHRGAAGGATPLAAGIQTELEHDPNGEDPDTWTAGDSAIFRPGDATALIITTDSGDLLPSPVEEGIVTTCRLQADTLDLAGFTIQRSGRFQWQFVDISPLPARSAPSTEERKTGTAVRSSFFTSDSSAFWQLRHPLVELG